jgi:hypothetical protein
MLRTILRISSSLIPGAFCILIGLLMLRGDSRSDYLAYSRRPFWMYLLTGRNVVDLGAGLANLPSPIPEHRGFTYRAYPPTYSNEAFGKPTPYVICNVQHGKFLFRVSKETDPVRQSSNYAAWVALPYYSSLALCVALTLLLRLMIRRKGNRQRRIGFPLISNEPEGHGPKAGNGDIAQHG